ncbi:MAG TPA: phosphoenolpyruvate--protein phosphotransferase [Treponema sp.]|nr:phosphoenolpyruvate--protein phosphotransferase [Treponema sp.]
MNVILGISASPGTGIGKAFIIPEVQERIIPKTNISPDAIDAGWSRFTDACAQVQKQIEDDLKTLPQDSLQKTILETYNLMLTDPVFLGEVKDAFKTKLLNIEYILDKKVDEYADRLRNSGNEYLAERAQDIEDVFNHVQDILLNYHPFDIEAVPDGAVIVASSLKTSDTIIMSKRKIAGLALTEGGISSHVTILAKSFGIPAVVGLEDIANQVQQDEELVVDGILGEVITSPDEKTLEEYKEKIAEEQRHAAALSRLRDLPAMTKDGTRFHLYANIGTPEEAEFALEQGADGIGLFRTEFLFMNTLQKQKEVSSGFSNSVSEETQFEAYKQVLQIMGDRPVTIRTLDAGGDKLIHLKDVHITEEKNPLMGLRAIRLSLYNPQLLRTQLRALYRASVYGNLRIMLPLITDVAQVETVKGIARGVRISLKEEKIPFKDVPIGIMVETAAAAICSDCLAAHSEFFSLGTNDLTQYTIGVDRENPDVAPLYNEFNLAVIRLIQFTIHNARKKNLPVSVCGEMAGRNESAMILAGLGIRQLSMAPKQIPVIKETLSRFSIQELRNIANQTTL